MAYVSPQADYQIRHSNKEPEWSSLCNNVFDEYLDTDELFCFDADPGERRSSDDSGGLFLSASSEQSHQTDGTSPFLPWEVVAVEAKQPQAKEPVNFWTKTLKALEKNAAESERRQQKLRSTKSHPDFLSLGGYPSPPAAPSSPTGQSFSAQRREARPTAANGKRRNITARSLSRGRPTGVTKSAVAGCVNPNATVRNYSASPSKMMTPSRHRAGFRDIWSERTQASPKKYELRVPSQAFLESPPPSGRMPNHDLATSGSPTRYPSLSMYDDQVSPLTNSFQQAHIRTPIASPSINALAYAQNSYYEPVPPLPNHYAPHIVPSNDTAPLYPERTSSLAPSKIQDFDFGFSSSLNTWTGLPAPAMGNYTTDPFAQDPFSDINAEILPSTEAHDFDFEGLGMSCDPSLVQISHDSRVRAPIANMTNHHPAPLLSNPYYIPPQQKHGPPINPNRSSHSRHRSLSPSPSLVTEPREPRSSRRATSSTRRASRHRRTKSTNSTNRNSQNMDRSGGFVNFTPHDCNKILNGVAPSGSSKTKARREKEAADKRRRFSQAAVKAVVEAGGDLDELSKAGLLI